MRTLQPGGIGGAADAAPRSAPPADASSRRSSNPNMLAMLLLLFAREPSMLSLAKLG
jgi:hypothetical protein